MLTDLLIDHGGYGYFFSKVGLVCESRAAHVVIAGAAA
jgi:hypothetical protein